MWLIVYIVIPFRPVRGHFEAWTEQREQSSGMPGTYKNCCTQGHGVHFCAQVQDRDLALGHRHRARILAWVCLKKECVLIGAQWVPYLDTVTGYHVWPLPKWMNVTKVSQKSKVAHPNKIQKQLAGLMRKTTKLNIRRLFCLLGEKRPTKRYSKQYEPLRG